MKRLSILIFLLMTLASCDPKSTKTSEKLDSEEGGAWLPKQAYRSKNPKAEMLCDSAAVLQIRAQQDPTLDDLQRLKLIQDAFSMLKEALELDPNYGMAMSNLSAIYLERRDTVKALELMRKRLKLEPDLAEGWQAVGIFTDLRGDSIEAKKYYQKSIEIYDSRLKMGKEYAVPENLMHYYDNWSSKSFSLLLSGETEKAHNSIKALLEEAAPIMGKDTETYATLLGKDRWTLLNEMKGN